MLYRLLPMMLICLLLAACGGGGGGGDKNSGGNPVNAPGGLSYTSPVTATVGVAVAAITPSVTGTAASFAVTPALPAGISLNTTSGAISGTPTAAAAQATYTVTATNAGGSTSFALVLTVNPQTAQGVFIDTTVSGLSYTSGGQSGLTDANGRFAYEIGNSVTFAVGGVTLGTTAGGNTVTPLDLVPGSSSVTPAVQNIVRFLMLMDSDGNAANGITISEALRARAASWPQVDFSSTDLDAALASIIPDTQVDGTIRQLPTAVDASSHFESSFRCLYAGYYRGTYSGGDNGNFAFTILPTGGMAGAAYSVPEDELIALQFAPALLPVRNSAAFVAGLAATGSSFSGEFAGYDQVSGTWSDGTFAGTRYAGTSSAAYKFLSLLVPGGGGPAVGSFFTEIDAEGMITVKPHVDFRTNEALDVVVTQDGSGFAIAGGTSGGNVTAAADTSALTLTGTWTNPDVGTSGSLVSTGCRLR